MLRLVLIWSSLLLVLFADAFVMKQTDEIRNYINIGLFAVIYTAISRNIISGVILASIDGLILMNLSLLSFWTHGLSLILSVVTLSTIFSRLLTNHSLASHLALTIIGTLVYYLTVIIINFLSQYFSAQSETLDGVTWLTQAGMVTITNALFSIILWRLTGQRYRSSLTEPSKL